MENQQQPHEQEPRRSPRVKSSLAQAAAHEEHKGIVMRMREWLDALIIAFVLAMFIRTYVLELYRIPSGSMSPTLLGDWVAEGPALDRMGNSQWYLLIRDRNSDYVQVFRKDSGYYKSEGLQWKARLTTSQQDLLDTRLHLEEHRLFVNKFAYWFSKPERGDIFVFRVPFSKEHTKYTRNGHVQDVPPFDRNRNLFVKRAVAFDGEDVKIGNDRKLYVDGKIVTEPPIFTRLMYTPGDTPEYSVKVPERTLLAFGDNTENSMDSRMWGPLPYVNVRGKAFFRFWPWRKMRFLN